MDFPQHPPKFLCHQVAAHPATFSLSAALALRFQVPKAVDAGRPRQKWFQLQRPTTNAEPPDFRDECERFLGREYTTMNPKVESDNKMPRHAWYRVASCIKNCPSQGT